MGGADRVGGVLAKAGTAYHVSVTQIGLGTALIEVHILLLRRQLVLRPHIKCVALYF